MEFACLSVVLVVNINAFACNIFELAAFGVAALTFLIFNVFRKAEHIEFLRLAFFVPLLVAYIPFYVEKKALNTA